MCTWAWASVAHIDDMVLNIAGAGAPWAVAPRDAEMAYVACMTVHDDALHTHTHTHTHTQREDLDCWREEEAAAITS